MTDKKKSIWISRESKSVEYIIWDQHPYIYNCPGGDIHWYAYDITTCDVVERSIVLANYVKKEFLELMKLPIPEAGECVEFKIV